MIPVFQTVEDMDRHAVVHAGLDDTLFKSARSFQINCRFSINVQHTLEGNKQGVFIFLNDDFHMTVHAGLHLLTSGIQLDLALIDLEVGIQP